ncbi:hypothetical protein VKS41_005213 [Umbelopsis sp. WA50703]
MISQLSNDSHFLNSGEMSREISRTSSVFDESYKIINDPIHGHIKLDQGTIDFIDTVQFQRLRDLKQLGSAYFVFPGGSHHRFEHSIGVGHLSHTLINKFRGEQPELEITDDEVQCVTLAGLCHDLGHGPFSHVFDSEFMPRARPGFKWSHEDASEMMLDYLIDDNHIDLEKHQINFIKDLIAGTPRSKSQYDERAFLFDIVANKRNSVDVDKFDYIERDCYNLGIKSSYDTKRLMWFTRVVDNQICYHHKEAYNLFELFHTRYSLFKRIYTHRVGKAIELMITDALLAADEHFGISKAVDNGEEYLNLTDDILRSIERSKEPELAPARHIMKRIRTRDLYKFVDEFLIPKDLIEFLGKDKINAREIIGHQEDNVHLSEDDVLVEFLKINYAMKDNNPVDSIKFYNRWDRAFFIPKEQVSYMVPSQFQEIIVRIYTRDSNKVCAVQRAFRRLLKTFGAKVPKNSPSSITPNAALELPEDFASPRKRRFDAGMDPIERYAPNKIVKEWSLKKSHSTL